MLQPLRFGIHFRSLQAQPDYLELLRVSLLVIVLELILTFFVSEFNLNLRSD